MTTASSPNALSESLIQLDKVGKIYRSGTIEVHALKDVSLTIHQGEFVAIVGQSGSGKTTLLDILGCLSRPTQGTYLFTNRSVGSLNEQEIAIIRNQQLGFIFQSFHLLPRKTALLNVELPLQYAGMLPRERRERAMELLNQVGLADRIHHLPNQLSGGQQQRVAIARALSNRPALLLADEPTGSLDSRSGEEILKLLQDLHQQGQTILFITHSRELAESAQRVIVLRDGEIVSDSSESTSTMRRSPLSPDNREERN